MNSDILLEQTLRSGGDLVSVCRENGLYNFLVFLGKKPIRIQMLCNWCRSEELHALWSKMLPKDSNIMLVSEQADYWIIINQPRADEMVYEPSKTIVFQMEPNMDRYPGWNTEWRVPDRNRFLQVFTHASGMNNVEWDLSTDFDTLLHNPLPPKTELISAVFSPKYMDPGHILRVDFTKYIERTIPIHVFGSNAFSYMHYKGSLPNHCKDNAMFPYKYHFNAENNAIPNYVTEKLFDAILAECLCFYWGCPNIEDLIDPRAYIRLELKNFEEDMQVVQDAIANDEWAERIDIIRAEKRRILTDLSLFQRIQYLL